jgi:RNA polymerase sigma-70 factor, ECF subfamily
VASTAFADACGTASTWAGWAMRGNFPGSGDPRPGPTRRLDHTFPDDRLRLIFTCCHPALAPEARIALTLREVCGLGTDAIAHAFLTQPATLAQRIVRAKRKIRDAGIPYTVPEGPELPERLAAVLRVVYLVFNEGYSAATGEKVVRADLCAEAIHLARLLAELMPEPRSGGFWRSCCCTRHGRRPAPRPRATSCGSRTRTGAAGTAR